MFHIVSLLPCKVEMFLKQILKKLKKTIQFSHLIPSKLKEGILGLALSEFLLFLCLFAFARFFFFMFYFLFLLLEIFKSQGSCETCILFLSVFLPLRNLSQNRLKKVFLHFFPDIRGHK